MKRQGLNTISRREFMIGLGAGVSLSLAAPAALWAATDRQRTEYWVSAEGASPNDFGLGWVSGIRGEKFSGLENAQTLASGFRGHGASQHLLRPHSVLLFARRPGVEAIEVDLPSGKIVARFHCAAGRHLFGHGCFSVDGSLLFTTEADYQNGRGVIAIRDAVDYRLLGEFDSFGVGPHDIRMLPDGKTLVIANGGILTHPDSGRKKLNLATMSSSLTYIDSKTGKKLDQQFLAEAKASIRHLDVSEDGTVVFATQLQREAAHHKRIVPLGGTHRLGGEVQLFLQPQMLIAQLNDYMGSVAVCNRSRIAGFTSPRGNLAVFWHLDSGEFRGYHKLRDVCGIAVSCDQQRFILSSSFGELRQLDAFSLQEQRSARRDYPDIRWDNHLLVAS